MSLNGVYQTIQWTIVKQMIEFLKYNDELTKQEWANERTELVDDLNNFVIDILGFNRTGITNAIEEEVNEAEQLIDEYIEQEFNITDLEHDEDQATRTAEYLNRDIMKALYSTPSRQGIVEETYLNIIDEVMEDDSDTELLLLIGAKALEQLASGLYSGFVQSDGKRWRMDRTVQTIDKHIFHDTFTSSFQQLPEHGVELVRVDRFVLPRDACADLQASGTICVVPREYASENAQQYPNIYDTQHKFLQPDGHHGKQLMP